MCYHSQSLTLEGISYLPLFQYESRLVLSPTHPLVDKKSPILPEDLIDETLIVYPVEAKRLDIIAHFFAPAGLAPKKLRTTELTAMLIQLVAQANEGLPRYRIAVNEYEKRLGNIKGIGEGVFCQLYAATRTTSKEVAYIQGF